MSKNTKPLNQLLNRTPVMSMTPDAAWPSPLEFIGVEIEVENATAPEELLSSKYWTTHVDQSLRNGIEFVFRGPLGGRDLSAAINEFFAAGVQYDCTPRTSIHIHINASDTMGIDDLRAMLALMYVIEPAVFRWADENRKYCGYCNPLTDLPPERLLGALFQAGTETDLIKAINPGQNSDRYYGFNMAALVRHGTLELRYFPCVTEIEPVIDWIKFTMCAKNTAMQTEDLRGMLKFMQNSDSLREFLMVNFQPVFDKLDPHMDYEDSAGRARYLYGATLTQPNNGTAPQQRSTNQSRGFRAFLTKSFPQIRQQDENSIAPSPAEHALAEQIELYRAAASNTTNASLRRLYRESTDNLERNVVAEAEINSRTAGITLDEYLTSTGLNAVLSRRDTIDPFSI